MTTVCAIIPTFNRALLLGQCIESLLRQTRPVDEILIVNDGSTDQTLEFLKQYDGRVRVVTKENGGKASAGNFGLKNTTADYIWLCDDDDLAVPGGLEALARVMDSNPALAFCYGRYQSFEDHEPDNFREPAYWGMPRFDRPIIDLLGNCYPYQMAMLVRRTAFEELGGLDATLIRAQDIDFVTRMSLRYEGQYVPQVVFQQRQHRGMRGTAKNPISQQSAYSNAMIFDSKILAQYRDALTPDHLTPRFAATWSPKLQLRCALLQRAAIFARRALWQETIADLLAADAAAPEPATQEELATAVWSAPKSQAWDILATDHASVRALRQASERSPYLRSIVQSLISPNFWYIRRCLSTRDFRIICQRVKLLLQCLGFGGLCQAFLARLIKTTGAK